MYTEFIGLDEKPFSISPNPRYLYMTEQHKEALAHLIYGIGGDGGVVLLTGEVGTGKTTLCRCFLERIAEGTDVALITNPKLSAEQLLETICDEFGLSYVRNKVSIKEYIDQINRRLFENHASGRHTVLIIDEAQNLNADVLEQLRLLTNLETDEKKLLQIVLIGHPELRDMFDKVELRQLAQRVTARYYLGGLDYTDVVNYVYHRLTVAGCQSPATLFPPIVLKKVYKLSQGIPRLVNILCDRALLGAFVEKRKSVDVPILKSAACEVLGRVALYRGRRFKQHRGYIASSLGLTSVVCAIGLILFFQGPVESSVGASDSPTASSLMVLPSSLSAQTLPTDKNERKIGQEAITKETKRKSLSRVSAPESALTTLANTGEGLPYDDLGLVLSVAPEPGEKGMAYRELFRLWNIAYSEGGTSVVEVEGNACENALKFGLACLQKKGSLQDLQHYDTPGIVSLHSDSGEVHHALLKNIDGEVLGISIAGKDYTVSASDWRKYWRGDFQLLWRSPPGYSGPFTPGNIGPMSKWVASRLDQIEGLSSKEGGPFYNKELADRVKVFQASVGEVADGIVGANTLILLSGLLDHDVPQLGSRHFEHKGE